MNVSDTRQISGVILIIEIINESAYKKICHYDFLLFVLQFGALTPLEPRLGKKLIEPLTNLIHR